jgi:hypothetical protein
VSEEMIHEIKEILRETFYGSRPGEGTQYLDHDSGIINTLRGLTAEQASQRHGSHPSIAAHVRHMNFHMKTAYEWISGDRRKRDWKASFMPQGVNPEEWAGLLKGFEQTKEEYLHVICSLPAEKLISESGSLGVVAHLAYHLGAIRQLLPTSARQLLE